MIKVFEKWGYEPIETPTVEPLEIFQGEIGEDEKLFFKFTDLGGRNVALRYDQSVPTCRFVGANFSKIILPFRRYQIQSNFRAEKPQRGRYREFVQADIDIFGVASPTADAETIAMSIDLYKTLGFKKVVALINNRDLMKDIPYPAIVAIDKLKKIGKDGVIRDMNNKGISNKQAEEYLFKVESLQPDETITTIFSYLERAGFDKEYYEFSPTLARSFSYSQGPIWEMVIPQYDAGSVGGGERYDGLMERTTGLKIPATGIAFGFDRTLEALEVCKLLPKFTAITKVLVSVFSPDFWDTSVTLASQIREAGIATEIYPQKDIKLDKQLKYADRRGIPYVIILGPNEIEKGVVTLKDFASKTQLVVARETLVEALKAAINR